MSRVKKSRKPGVGKRAVLSDADKKLIVPTAKKPKKKVGKEAGNRQKEAFSNKEQSTLNNANKDPRIGNKTPIDLTPQTPIKENTKNNVTTAQQKNSPIAAIKRIEPIELPTIDLENELYAIEDDAQLQIILALQDEDKPLNDEQIDYFNKKMDRHQALRELLGWNDEDEDNDDETDSQHEKNSEDDLWDSLDKTDFSKYE